MQSFGACKIWIVQNLDDYAKFVLCKIWIEQDLDHVRCEICVKQIIINRDVGVCTYLNCA
jgi:hypothetical protein